NSQIAVTTGRAERIRGRLLTQRLAPSFAHMVERLRARLVLDYHHSMRPLMTSAFRFYSIA
ncbi:MAG: hypothetical protein VCB82_12110, partial [Alphaproteobacteria bacterium]